MEVSVHTVARIEVTPEIHIRGSFDDSTFYLTRILVTDEDGKEVEFTLFHNKPMPVEFKATETHEHKLTPVAA